MAELRGRPTLIVIDDVVDVPMTDEQRAALQRWWNETKHHAHVRSSPFTHKDWLGRFYFGTADGRLEQAH